MRKETISEGVPGICFLLILCLAMASCGGTRQKWSGNYSFPGNTWRADNILVFEPDTAFLEDNAPLKGLLSLRYGANASLEDIPVVMEIESPQDGLYICDTISLKLLPIDDRTASKATMGIYEYSDTLKLRSRPLPGWTISFYPADIDEVDGLFSLTFDLCL